MHRNEHHDSLAPSPHPASFFIYFTRFFVSLLFLFFFFFPPSSAIFSSRRLLGRARFRFQPYELLGHLVVGPLREDPHDGEARVVHVHAADERIRGVQADLIDQVSELQHGDADDAVLASEAVVLQRHVELVRLRPVLATQDTAEERDGNVTNKRRERIPRHSR